MRSQRGFTLIELMVVVAIIGVLMAVAVGSMSQDADPTDDAAAAANLLREASRKAISGGAIRDDVALANLVAERTRLRVSADGGPLAIVLERVQENDSPDDGFVWVELRRHHIGADVELFGYADATALDPDTVTPIPLPTGDVTIACFPDGRCEPKTLFFRDASSDTRRVRVVVMPCNGAPLVFDGW